MDEIRKLIDTLTLRQKVSIVAAALAVGLALYGISNWNRERDFQPLYTSMAPEDAGQVVERLRESNVPYRLTDAGATVLVPSAQVAEMRLRMAASGLPRSGRLGFELFDQTNFGATDFTEKVNYHRALEGELERSVTALAEVERARIHITFPKESVFLESRRPAKSSVMLQMRPGADLSPQNVQAVCYLVSSAVEGLEPGAVSVLDMRGNLLSRPKSTSEVDGGQPSAAHLEYRKSIEDGLLAKIDATLTPLLGPDGFRAGISVECDFTSGERSEEIFDPTLSVMATSQRTEDTSGTASAAGGIPGTSSNLPRPAPRLAGSPPGRARRTENIAYQTSRTVQTTRIPQGEIKRLSVSLLVDHEVAWEGEGAGARRTVSPPSEEKLQSIRDIVSGAIGFQADRGDQLIVENLLFESTRNWQSMDEAVPAAPAGGIELPSWVTTRVDDPKLLILIATGVGLALLVFVVGAFVFLRRRRKKRKVESVSTDKALPAGAAAMPPAIEEGPGVESKMQERLAEQAALKARLEEEALKSLKLGAVKTKKTEVLTKHLADEAEKEPAAMAQLVRTWLNEEGD